MKAKKGDRVKVHYTLKDANGQVVETSLKAAPIEFTIGEGKIIPGFEKGIIGMAPKGKKTVTLSPDEGYGPHEKKKVFEFNKKNAPQDFDPQIGQTVKMHRPDGQSISVTVVGRTEDGFMMDANHPLAGKELTFELELMEIVKQ